MVALTDDLDGVASRTIPGVSTEAYTQHALHRVAVDLGDSSNYFPDPPASAGTTIHDGGMSVYPSPARRLEEGLKLGYFEWPGQKGEPA